MTYTTATATTANTANTANAPTRRERAVIKAERAKVARAKAARRAVQLQFDFANDVANDFANDVGVVTGAARVAWQESTAVTPIKWVPTNSTASGCYHEVVATAAQTATAAAAKVERIKEQAQRAQWEQLLVLLKAQYGLDVVITAAEWAAKQLEPAKAKALGLKSPKLSKALVALGVPAAEVSLVLGASTVRATTQVADTWVSQDLEDLWDQGNSVHYSSCQATDERAAWNGSMDMCEIDQEAEHFGRDLFLWVAGQRMSIDGAGFTARAKLRVLYHDHDCTEVAGLYIDRPYGAAATLKAGLVQLAEWWAKRSNTSIFMPTTWERQDGAGNDFQYQYEGKHEEKLYSPSSSSGYQDTMTRGYGPYDFMVPIAQHGSLIKRAFTARPKEGNVYLLPLKAVKYNPQTDKFAVPKVPTRSARRPITESYRYVRSLAVSLGLTSFKYNGELGGGYGAGTIVYEADNYKFFANENYIRLTDNKGHTTYCEWEKGTITVKEGNKELGLVVSKSLPYEYDTSKRSLKVLAEEYWSPDEVKYGFMMADELPYTYDNKELKVISTDTDFEPAIELQYICSPGLLTVVYEPKGWYKAVALDKSNISDKTGHVYIKDHEDFLSYHKLLWAERDILYWDYIG